MSTYSEENKVPELPSQDAIHSSERKSDTKILFVVLGIICSVVCIFFSCVIFNVISLLPYSSSRQELQSTQTQLSIQATIIFFKSTPPAVTKSRYDPNLIIGVWNCPIIRGGTIEIKKDNSGMGYIGIQVSEDSATSYKGETIEEFRFDPTLYLFEGRHLWGGGKSTTTKWGSDGGLVIEIINANTIFVRYLDSKYTGGWTFTRVSK
jgi:hypothetical protein